MAAGEGQRMRPLTLTTPKPLLKIKGRPIIDYIFSALPEDIDEMVVVVKYLAGQIKNFLGAEYKGRGISFVEGSDKGNAYSFWAAKEFIGEERFLFFYGDELPNPEDVKNCLAHDLSILVFKPQKPKANGLVSLKPDGTISEIIEKPEEVKSALAADGIMVLNSEIFNYPPQANDKGEYYFTSLLNQFVKNHKVWPVESRGFIGDITTPADLERVEKIFEMG